MTYAAYLRIYEPVAAFHEPERSRPGDQAVHPGQRQSAAEISAAIDGVTKGERELAAAMYKRAQSRWRAFAEYEMAN